MPGEVGGLFGPEAGWVGEGVGLDFVLWMGGHGELLQMCEWDSYVKNGCVPSNGILGSWSSATVLLPGEALCNSHLYSIVSVECTSV